MPVISLDFGPFTTKTAQLIPLWGIGPNTPKSCSRACLERLPLDQLDYPRIRRADKVFVLNLSHINY
jgi:hypothetical protein